MPTLETRKPSIAVLMTCFNRRESTLRCLEALFAQFSLYPRSLHLVLVDDLSSDGTADAVRARYPDAQVLSGTGNLFWNRGMHTAFAEAMKRDFDYYFWLNDDTLLMPHALDTFLATTHSLHASGITAIVTGTTCDLASGRRTYGGIKLLGVFLRRLAWIDPLSDKSQPCDTMNGNCTLIPRAVALKIGNLDPAFHHSFGDMDYGFRAAKAGFPIYVAPGFLGACLDNPKSGTWRDRSASLAVRWKHLNSAKGSPFPEWFRYCHRHLGPLWPIYAVSPYIKTLASGVFGSR